MAVTPTPRLVACREQMQREFEVIQAAVGPDEQFAYEASTAQWLISQLPGADFAQIGWAIILVSAAMYPDLPMGATEGKVQQGGQRFTLILASRVGEALLADVSAAAPPGDSFEVGPKLASRDLSEIYSEMPWLPSSSVPDVDPAVLRREFQQAMSEAMTEVRQELVSELPGADLSAIGWALLGTGTTLLARTVQFYRGRWRRGAKRSKELQTSAFNNGLFLAAIGDYLVGPRA
jgi:hypothetical protein